MKPTEDFDMVSRLPMFVAPAGGEFEQVKVYLPQDKRQRHPIIGWTCVWCDWLGVAPTAEHLPAHECLSNLDGVCVVRN